VPIWSEVLANVYLWQQTKQKQITMTTEEKREIREAVHASPNFDKLLYFRYGTQLTDAVCKMIYNGTLIGLYKTEDGKIMAQDIWGEHHVAE